MPQRVLIIDHTRCNVTYKKIKLKCFIFSIEAAAFGGAFFPEQRQ
jgi:hypothetical protein